LSSARSSRIISIMATMAILDHAPSLPGRAFCQQASSPNAPWRALADRHEVVAGVEAGGDLADVLAQRLAVAQQHASVPSTSICAPASLM
jgi:hypothetical protein